MKKTYSQPKGRTSWDGFGLSSFQRLRQPCWSTDSFTSLHLLARRNCFNCASRKPTLCGGSPQFWCAKRAKIRLESRKGSKGTFQGGGFDRVRTLLQGPGVSLEFIFTSREPLLLETCLPYLRYRGRGSSSSIPETPRRGT